jgi:hypothetical protein
VFKNNMLLREFGPKRKEVKCGGRKLYNRGIQSTCCSSKILKSNMME